MDKTKPAAPAADDEATEAARKATNEAERHKVGEKPAAAATKKE